MSYRTNHWLLVIFNPEKFVNLLMDSLLFAILVLRCLILAAWCLMLDAWWLVAHVSRLRFAICVSPFFDRWRSDRAVAISRNARPIVRLLNQSEVGWWVQLGDRLVSFRSCVRVCARSECLLEFGFKRGCIFSLFLFVLRSFPFSLPLTPNLLSNFGWLIGRIILQVILQMGQCFFIRYQASSVRKSNKHRSTTNSVKSDSPSIG